MDKPSNEISTSGRYALLDELRGLDLLSMIGYHAVGSGFFFVLGMSAAWYTVWQGHLWQAEHLLGVHSAVWLLPAAGASPLRRGLIVSGAGVLVTAVTLLFMPEDRVGVRGAHPAGGGHAHHRPSAAAAAKIPAWAGWWCRCCSSRQPTTHRMASGSWARGRYCCQVPGMPTSSRRSSAFSREAFSPRITFRCCPGCFCSGQGTSCISAWGGPAWSRCAGRSVRRWAGWADIRWGSICWHQPVIYGVLLLLFHVFEQ